MSTKINALLMKPNQFEKQKFQQQKTKKNVNLQIKKLIQAN